MVLARKGVGAGVPEGDLDHGGRDEPYLLADVHERGQSRHAQPSKRVGGARRLGRRLQSILIIDSPLFHLLLPVRVGILVTRERAHKAKRVARIRIRGETGDARRVARQLVKLGVLLRQHVLNGHVGQNLRGRRSRRDKVRLRVDRDLLRAAEGLDRRANGRSMAFNTRRMQTTPRGILAGRQGNGRSSTLVVVNRRDERGRRLPGIVPCDAASIAPPSDQSDSGTALKP